jgi:molecular chaperone GrpE (heat shock protein)
MMIKAKLKGVVEIPLDVDEIHTALEHLEQKLADIHATLLANREQLAEGIFEAFIFPLVDRVILLRDLLEDGFEAEQLHRFVKDALALMGVEEILVMEGDPVDPIRHEVVEIQKVSDPRLDGKVLRVHRAGYIRAGRIVRPAKVIAGRYVREEVRVHAATVGGDRLWHDSLGSSHSRGSCGAADGHPGSAGQDGGPNRDLVQG